MKPKDRRVFRLLQAHLKSKSFERYCSLLNSLLVAHREHAFLKDLSDALRQRDFMKMYACADSLSEQQYSDATQHFVANQFSLLIKKYPFPVKELDLAPEKRARLTFEMAERRVHRINKKFSIISDHRSRDRYLSEAKASRSWIKSVIGSDPNYKRIFSSCDFGPGASVGVHGNATHVLAKLSSEKWSVTPGALHHGFAGMMNNFHYLEQLLPRVGDSPPCLDYEFAFEAYLRRIHVVKSNIICFVPKTAKTLRSIAIEPLMNGFVQKGIDLELRKKLKFVNIDLSDQSLNQKLARLGSTDDSDTSFVTIDMSSASDSISTELVRYLLPDSWFRLLDRTRSHSYVLDSEEKIFNKFCSMGNGFCFPLETLIFSSALSLIHI